MGYEREGKLAAGAVYDPSQDELFLATAGGGATRERPADRRLRHRHADRGRCSATGFPYDRALRPDRRCASSRPSVCRPRPSGGSARRRWTAAWVAAGRFDGYWENVVNAWDVAAGALIAREAGATVTDLHGAPFQVDVGSILMATPAIHPLLRRRGILGLNADGGGEPAPLRLRQPARSPAQGAPARRPPGPDDDARQSCTATPADGVQLRVSVHRPGWAGMSTSMASSFWGSRQTITRSGRYEEVDDGLYVRAGVTVETPGGPMDAWAYLKGPAASP